MNQNVSFALACRVLKYRLAVVLSLMLASFNAISQELDQRQAIQLNDAQRAHVLAEMRAMLSGTQVILASLAANDMTEVSRQASLLGMSKKNHNAEDTVHDALPPAFMQLGMSLHRSFDAIAADAEAGADAKHVLTRLSAAMNACVSCHESYQIQRAANPQPIQPANNP